jgi:hypothetical protein
MVLANAGLNHLAPKLILNGYETVEDLLELTREDLDYLGITQEEYDTCSTAAHCLAKRIHYDSSSSSGYDSDEPANNEHSENLEAIDKSEMSDDGLALRDNTINNTEDFATDSNLSLAVKECISVPKISPQWTLQESFLFKNVQTVIIRL